MASGISFGVLVTLVQLVSTQNSSFMGASQKKSGGEKNKNGVLRSKSCARRRKADKLEAV